MSHSPSTLIPLLDSPAPAVEHPVSAAPPLTPAATPVPRCFRETPVGRLGLRLFRVLASLHLALGLLSSFTLCLIGATLLESAFSARIAQDLIYRTWWFSTLLGLLALNVACAALKKYPWQRHQLGFLITHAGLLVLILGGLLTTLGGTEGQMLLLDSDNSSLQKSFRLPSRSDVLQRVDEQQLEIVRVPPGAHQDDALLRALLHFAQGGQEIDPALRERLGADYSPVPLRPGSFAWHADDRFQPRLPWFLHALHFLADPFPGLERSLNAETSLVVKNYYPHTERWPFAPAPHHEDGFPALQLALHTPMIGPRPMKRWVTSLPSFEVDPSPIALEFFLLNEPALLPEFLTPPPSEQLGQAGQLVLALGPSRQLCRIDLNKLKDGETLDLPQAGVQFTLKRRAHLMELLSQGPRNGPPEHRPEYPAILFQLTRGTERGEYIACARLPHLPAFQRGSEVLATAAWYHVADFRWGERHRLGSVQFLQGPNGTLYYRVFGKDGLSAPGQALDPADTTTRHTLPWKPMDMHFQVLSYLPRAIQQEYIVPRHVPPGAETAEKWEPALRCELTTSTGKQDFMVRMGPLATQVKTKTDLFFVRYRQASQPLDFSLELKKAQQHTDPGTNRPAAYESEVVLTHSTEGVRHKEQHTISMNRPLKVAGFKVFQTQYQPLVNPQTMELLVDERGELVSLSGLTLAHDPGLWFKYAGSMLIVLGIATMFWMRAYFFKPRPHPVAR